MRKKFFLSMFILLAVFAAACSSSSNSNTINQRQGSSPNADNKPPQAINASPNQTRDKNTPPQVITISAPRVAIKGGTGEVVISIKIADGYHINANPPSEAFLKPTEVEITSANGITAEKPVYPPALNKKFPFSEKEIAVYEKEATIKVKLRAAAGATKGEQLITGVLRYQACDNEVCYPPTNMDLMIATTIN